jgi:hypothetical protein
MHLATDLTNVDFFLEILQFFKLWLIMNMNLYLIFVWMNAGNLKKKYF